MSNDRRLSLSFGDFKCDIVGYDEPSDILDQVVRVISDIARTTGRASLGADLQTAVIQALNSARSETDGAAWAGDEVDVVDGRLVITAGAEEAAGRDPATDASGPTRPRISVVRAADKIGRRPPRGLREEPPLTLALDQLVETQGERAGHQDSFFFSDPVENSAAASEGRNAYGRDSVLPRPGRRSAPVDTD